MTDELASEIFKKNVVVNQTNRDNAGTALADEDVDTVHYWLYSPGDGALNGTNSTKTVLWALDGVNLEIYVNTKTKMTLKKQ